ncbi:MarR family transcriptional regulator [Actinopolyspora biskrensis]|uniref:MarR family winged helix-turn-helix transcriptional regulator n=1 Tax=Actinopolyspora biskrensis TaxID=1470178 RepID=UPI0015C76980
MTRVTDHAEDDDGPGASDADAPLTLYLVKRLEMVVRALMDDALRPHGLTTLQYTALTVLERRGELSSAQLARRSFVTPQTMHEMVRWLERRELVHRRRDETNRRVLLIGLTRRGNELVTACAPLIDALEQRVLDSMNPGERMVFRECLERGHAALTPLVDRGSGSGGPAAAES